MLALLMLYAVSRTERQLLTQQELSKVGKGYLEAGEHLSLERPTQRLGGT